MTSASECVSAHSVSARNPMRATPDSLARTWFRRPPFRSPLLWGCFLFLRVLRCFSSPTYLPRVRVPVHHHRGVAPFGDDGLTGCLRLPHPFAAGPRPSSAGRAEASSNRASCLAWSWITRQSRAPPTTRLARSTHHGWYPSRSLDMQCMPTPGTKTSKNISHTRCSC